MTPDIMKEFTTNKNLLWTDENLNELLKFIRDNRIIKEVFDGKRCLDNTGMSVSEFILDEFKKSKKTYEILSFANDLGDIFKLTLGGWYRMNDMPIECKWRTAEWMLKNALDCNITSVMRLRDREVFSVGDKLACGYSIKSFKIENGSMQAFYNTLERTYGWLLGLSKLKEPLLITEDRVEMYDRSDLIHIVKDFEVRLWKVSDYLDSHAKNKEGMKVFRSRMEAEEYAVQNKRCLSIKDFTSQPLSFTSASVFEALKKIVKER